MIKKLLLAAGIIVIGLLFLPISASAQRSQLRQTITPLDCTLTMTLNGSGTVNNTDCDPQPPRIDNVDINNGRPIITGRYDSVNSLLFRVKWRGIWYVLGEPDSRLTASGNLWRLDFSDISEPFEAGSYDIILEMTSLDADTLGGVYNITITESAPPTPEVSVTPIPAPSSPSAPNTGFIMLFQSYAVPSLIVVSFAIAFIFAAVNIMYILRNAKK